MNVFCDWTANRGNVKSQLILALFRCCAVMRQWPGPAWLLGLPFYVIHELGVVWVMGVELRYATRVGPRLRLFHGQGLVVHKDTVIGADCVLRQNTTIGSKVRRDGTSTDCPVIGDRVDIGAHAVIIGEIRIGDDAVIGAGAVVVKDVPAGAVMVGNPARRIEKS